MLSLSVLVLLPFLFIKYESFSVLTSPSPHRKNLLNNIPFSNGHTLVILESWSFKQYQSHFFNTLKKEHNQTIDFRSASDTGHKISLKSRGEYYYNNLIILGSNINFKKSSSSNQISVDNILKYLDDGYNLMVATDHQMSKDIRRLAYECGIRFDKENIIVQDNQNYDHSSSDHYDIILSSQQSLIQQPTIIGDLLADANGLKSKRILWRGVAQKLPKASNLVFKILTGGSTTFASDISINSDKVKEAASTYGKSTILVSALQGRNNARATFFGSIDLCSDRFVDKAILLPYNDSKSKHDTELSSNSDFCSSLVQQTFKQRGLLRANNVVHHLASNNSILNPSTYTIKDQIKYSVDISQWSYEKQQWIPYTAKDVQIELLRMDPFQLRTMKTNGKGNYQAEFQLPEIFGIYHLTIDYKHRGYNHLMVSRQISVRPLRHNQHQRFLLTALPYYVSEFAVLISFFLFTLFFMIHRSNRQKEKTKTE